MDMKVAFRVAVIVAVVVLVIVLRLQITTDITVPLTEGKISYFNLLFDVVVGIFTVWGLYWAASELALKPELRLSIEPAWERTASKKSRALIGPKEDGMLEGDLFLMNTQPRAARYIQVVLCVHSFPRPHVFSVEPVEGAYADWVPFGAPMHRCLRVQFGDDFVIYKGEAIYVGVLKVGWPDFSADASADYRPRDITFEAKFYSLEGEPKKEVISLPIIWT